MKFHIEIETVDQAEPIQIVAAAYLAAVLVDDELVGKLPPGEPYMLLVGEQVELQRDEKATVRLIRFTRSA